MSVISRIKNFRKEIHDKRFLEEDIKNYINCCSNSSLSIKNGNKAARDIMVYCHVIEKGLSHKKLKPLFGYDRIMLISNSLKEYLNTGGSDKFVISMAISTLNLYNSVNRNLGVSPDKFVPIPQGIDFQELDIGAMELSGEEFFIKDFDFKKFSKARHSMRLYDCSSELIDDNDIIDSIKDAQSAPSACNRQSSRIKIVKNRDMMNKILNVQGGAKSFGKNAGALLIVTADLSLYELSERRLPTLDAGLFIMNLVYALYDHKIGSCILNGSFTKEREKEIEQLVPIPKNEAYCAIIALSKIPEFERILVAKSVKRSVNDIITFI